jgi:hypothetical protein
MRLEPPYATKGSTIPLVGSKPVVTPILRKAGKTIRRVSPRAREKQKVSSAQRDAITRPRQSTTEKTTMTKSAPKNPSSSDITAKIKSVCAAGRKKSFCWLAPIATAHPLDGVALYVVRTFLTLICTSPR